ncbi:MAG: hypothetical protein QM730_23080 [Anaerolineales bacterium]
MKKVLFIFTITAIILSACSVTTTPIPETTKPVSPTQLPSPTITATSVPEETAQRGHVTVFCTNTLSDATTINTAIAGSSQGDEIIIVGQCLIDQTIKLIGDRSYRGTSRSGTILKQADGANLTALLATDNFLENRDWATPVYIERMMLDGNRANNPQTQTDGIILASWLSVVNDVWITNMSRDGLRTLLRHSGSHKAYWFSKRQDNKQFY